MANGDSSRLHVLFIGALERGSVQGWVHARNYGSLVLPAWPKSTLHATTRNQLQCCLLFTKIKAPLIRHPSATWSENLRFGAKRVCAETRPACAKQPRNREEAKSLCHASAVTMAYQPNTGVKCRWIVLRKI